MENGSYGRKLYVIHNVFGKRFRYELEIAPSFVSNVQSSPWGKKKVDLNTKRRRLIQ